MLVKPEVLLSIVTVVYNGERFISPTLESIIARKSSEIELVVVDGASRDGTLSILKNYQDQIDQFVSEPDEGIFDAMNKGISMSRGQWVVFINAGDEFLLDVNSVEWQDYKNTAVLYGNTMRSGGLLSRPYAINMIESGSLPMCHQSTLYNKSLLKDQLTYDTTFKLFGENALLMKLYVQGCTVSYVDQVFSFFLGGGISDQVSWQTRKAKFYFLYKYFGLFGVLKGIIYKAGLLKYDRE